jgi:4-aminobutyrate aminotransferase-like enzyme
LSRQLQLGLGELRSRCPQYVVAVRSLGMIAAIDTPSPSIAARVQRACFDAGLIVETCGPDAATLKLLPPLIVTSAMLQTALDVIECAFGGLRDAV